MQVYLKKNEKKVKTLVSTQEAPSLSRSSTLKLRIKQDPSVRLEPKQNQTPNRLLASLSV